MTNLVSRRGMVTCFERRSTMNSRQQRALAFEAFKAGAANGGGSSPSDADHAAIQESIRVAFQGWWGRYLERKARP